MAKVAKVAKEIASHIPGNNHRLPREFHRADHRTGVNISEVESAEKTTDYESNPDVAGIRIDEWRWSMILIKQFLRLVSLVAIFLIPSGMSAGSSALAFQDTTLITFTCCQYSPDAVAIAAGDTVQWSGTFAEHPLVSEDNLWPVQNSGDTFEFTFANPGVYRFYCQLHGGPGGVGMSGRVTVGTNIFLPIVIQ